MRLIVLLILAVTMAGAWEMARHRRARRRLPVRVHVNGSRGKSSVTRLIAAGLQAGGIPTCAKTTGSAAQFLHVDGSETPVERLGPPNIREQLSVFRQAADEGARALVIECMAVRPDLQRVCEHSIVRATVGVITNARPDHLEIMGPTMTDVALSLANTVPRRALLFTAEQRYASVLQQRAAALGTGLRRSSPEAVTAADLAGFAYVEFADNVALALDVCEHLGVPRDVALAGMWRVTPDVGALEELPLPIPGRDIRLVNAFAANDPSSTLAVWRRLGLDRAPQRPLILFNNRADRLRRARDMAPLLGTDLRAVTYVVCGEATRRLISLLPPSVSRAAVVDAGGRDVDQLLELLSTLAADGALVVGIGNIGGIGLELVQRCTLEVTA